MINRLSMILSLLGATLLFAVLLSLPLPGSAAPSAQEATPIPNLSIGDDTCLSCHGTPGQTFPLEDGSLLDLFVDPLDHANSIHGSQGYACVQCHSQVGQYPHPTFSAADLRDATIQLNAVCQRCHAPQYQLAQDSVHARAQASGNRNAAVCTDCHTAHRVQDWVDEESGETLQSVRTLIPQTCAQCHNDIYQTYLTSVHGSALTEENNPDVPTCIDCHGVHNIEDPTTAAFRLASPQMCAKCHTDPDRMAKYNIPTDVLDTYVADFHGTTVTIFEKQTPDAETNKPVCYDCHGVHNISRADDPKKGLQVRDNLLAACQKCHPNAQDNFPTAWLSHYIPSPDKYPVVYYVNLFYKFLIPTVLGGMAILVVMDAARKLIDLSKRRSVKRPEQVLEAAPAGPVAEASSVQELSVIEASAENEVSAAEDEPAMEEPVANDPAVEGPPMEEPEAETSTGEALTNAAEPDETGEEANDE